MLRHMDSDHSSIVKQTIQFMNTHLEEPLVLEDLASVAGFSPYHFDRLFRKTTGIPPRLFLSALRMEKGKELLLTTQADITEIALSVGYSSMGSFSTRFSKSVGVSPKSFRALNQHGLEAIAVLRETSENPLQSRYVNGEIVRPESFDGIIFVGLFPKPIPNCRPVCGSVLTNETHFYFNDVPDGIYFVMAAAFNWSDSNKTFLMPKDSLRGAADGPVFISRGVARGYTDVILREADPTDPPILVSLPILLSEEINIAK